MCNCEYPEHDDQVCSFNNDLFEMIRDFDIKIHQMPQWAILKFDTQDPHLIDQFRAHVLSMGCIYLGFKFHACKVCPGKPPCRAPPPHSFHIAHFIKKPF